MATKLTDSAVKKLTCKRTLIQDATKNLKQRVAEFNADNPEKPITYHQLRRLYRDQRIRFKKVLTKLNQSCCDRPNLPGSGTGEKTVESST